MHSNSYVSGAALDQGQENQMSIINVDCDANQTLAAELLGTSFARTVLEGSPAEDDNFASGVVVSVDGQTFKASNLPEPDETATDGHYTVCRYDLNGCTVFLTSGAVDAIDIYASGTRIQDLLCDWDTDGVEQAEHLSSWGFDGTPDEAEDDATDVRVWCEPNYYYAGHAGAPIGKYVCDMASGQHLVFDTVAGARQWIDTKESGIYTTSSGEAGRPAYTVCA